MSWDPEYRRKLLELMCDFWHCPCSDRVLMGSQGDDKVLCPCRQSNPAWPQEYPGCHIKRLCRPATVDQYLAYEQKQEVRRG